jgi:hypothetical protein
MLRIVFTVLRCARFLSDPATCVASKFMAGRALPFRALAGVQRLTFICF